METDEFVDINDLIFQERMTIDHDFVPTSASFTSMDEENKFAQYDGGEYLLVGGGTSLVLWKLRKQVIDPVEKPKKTRGGFGDIGVVQTTQSFNPAKRLGARIGINGIVGLTFNEKTTDKPKKRSLGLSDEPQEEFTRESSLSLGTLDQALGRSPSPSNLAETKETGPLNQVDNTQVPWGQVREWFVDDDEDGNSLFPNTKTPYRQLWKKRVAGVRVVSFSPDGRMFASVGHSDRHVKVWFYGSNALTFTYLAHPRAVADIQWRRYHAKREFCRNVLMTRLVDGTVMMWEETEPTQRLEFALKLTLTEPVTSVQWLLPPVSYLTDILDEHVRERGNRSSNIPNYSNPRGSSYVPSHAPSSSSSSFLPLKQQPRGVCPFDCQHRTLPAGEKDSLLIAPLNASPKETQDWVAALQKDGSILLWKVKGLGVPRRIPTATLWSRLRQVISAKVDDFFPHLVVLSQRFSFKEKVYHPALLNVYTSSASKRDIACWTVDTSHINRAQAQLSRRLQGHVSTIFNLQAHPGNALLSSSDKYRTVIWKLTDTTISDSTFVLQDLCGLPASRLSKWDPLDPIIYLYLPHSAAAAAAAAAAAVATASSSTPSTSILSTNNSHSPLTSTPRQTSHHLKEGIICYLLDYHDSDSVSAWATSKNLGILDNSWNLEDDHGNPVELGHLEVLPPVYFDSTGACIKLPSNESLVLGASTDGRVIFIWKVTKELKKPSSNSKAPSTAPTAAPPLGQTTAHWSSAAPLEKHAPATTTASATTMSQRDSRLSLSSSSNVRTDSVSDNGGLNSCVRSKMIVRYVLPEVARLSCLAKPVSTHIRDMRQHQSDASLFTGGIDGIVRAWRLHKKPHVDYGAGGADHIDFEWLPLLYFRAHDEPVESIRCASFGRMATTSASGLEIKIWEGESSSPNFLLEAVIQAKAEEKTTASKFTPTTGLSAASAIIRSNETAASAVSTSHHEYDDSDSDDDNPLDPYAVMMSRTSTLRPTSYLQFAAGLGTLRSSSPGLRSSTSSVQSDSVSTSDAGISRKVSRSGTAFDWISGPTGSPILAVVASGTTRIFAQQATTHLFDFKASWVPIGSSRVSGSVIAWTGLGQLVVGQGNRLLVFTNWIDDSTLTTIAERMHAALPYYHPKVIFELVMAGRLDRAHATFKALHGSLSKTLPKLFELAATTPASNFTAVSYQDADDEYTAELLRNHPDLQKEKGEGTAEGTGDDGETENEKEQPKIVTVGDVDALPFDTDPKLLEAGELYLTQKRMGITSTKASTNPGSTTISPASSSLDLSQRAESAIKAPPEISIPDFDPMAYDPTAGPRGGSHAGKSKGLFDSDSDEDKKSSRDAYPSHLDDDSRYNIGAADHQSDSEDDFWGTKKGEESEAHKRFLDDGLEDYERGDSSSGAAPFDGPTSSTHVPPSVSSGLPSTPQYEKQSFRWNFEMISQQKANQLCQVLGRCVIIGLRAEEQAYLIALIETLSNLEQTWLDAAAVRFTVMTRFFLWMQRTNKLPSSACLSSLTWCWALHTYDQQSLLQHCFPFSSMNTTKTDIVKDSSKFPLLWDTVRSLGIPLWLTHLDSLRSLCQDLAIQHYLVKKDPNDAALWYLLLGKKSALAALYKITREDKKHEFLSNDFSQEKYKSAAVTNAYSLIQRHQYQMAAAMFVLAGKLSDAVDVCLSKMEDYMLGLFVARVASNTDDGAQAKRVMEEGLKQARVYGDQQKESALLWLLNDYKAALGSLIPQAPRTTIILSPYTIAPRLSSTGSSSASRLQQATSPKAGSSTSLTTRVSISKENRRGFFSDDDDGNASDGYDYKQFDIRSGMSDIYGGYPRDDAPTSGSEVEEAEEEGEETETIIDFTPECTNPLYQHHDISELSPQKVLIAAVTPDFSPGIRSLFDFVLSHPTLKLAMQEAEKKSAELSVQQLQIPLGRLGLARTTSRLSLGNSLRTTNTMPNLSSPLSSLPSGTAAALPDPKEASDLLILGEMRMKDFLHRKIIYTYIHSGLSRLVLQGDLDELAERVANVDTTGDKALEKPLDAWLLDASQSPVLSVGSELVARELEFKCAVQFLSKEIEAHRSMQVAGSLDTYNRFLQLILTYHSALTPDSIVAALGQFCEHRLYLFHHYLLLRTSSAATPIIYSASSQSLSVVGELQPIPSHSLVPQNNSESSLSEAAATATPTDSITTTTSGIAPSEVNRSASSSSIPIASQLAKSPSETIAFASAAATSAVVKNGVRDPAAAAQLLIRTAQKITALCQTLVTNPLSDHQARTTQLLATELAACLAIHLSDSAVTFSAKAKAGIGAAVRLGHFVANWSTKNYAALFELLSSKPTLDNPQGTLLPMEDQAQLKFESVSSSTEVTLSSSSSNVPTVIAPTPTRKLGPNEDADPTQPPVSASEPNTPTLVPLPQRAASTAGFALSGATPSDSPGSMSATTAGLFPTREEMRRLEMVKQARLLSTPSPSAASSSASERTEPISSQTELFLSRLLDVMLLVAFTNQQEGFLSSIFPNPTNLVKTLKSWMLQLENQLKDIPVQIIEERLQDITEKESRFVFDLPFFAPFIRESKLYEEVEVAPRLWTLLAALPCVSSYLHNADYLKQSMRFVRMHNQLRDDFDEAERNEALHVAAAWQYGANARKDVVPPSKDPQRINLKLGEPYALFKHKEIIQSFCINATCRKQLAIATSYGIVEVNVEHKAPLPYVPRNDPASSPTTLASMMTSGTPSSSSDLSSSGGVSNPQQHRRTNSDGSTALPSGMGDLSSLSSTPSGLSATGASSANTSKTFIGVPSISGAHMHHYAPSTGFPSGPLSAAQGGLLNPIASSSSSSTTSNSSSAAHGGATALGLPTSSSTSSPQNSVSSHFSMLPESIDKPDIALWLEAHPTLPFYMSASGDGPVKLWQFNVAQPSALTTYRSKHKSKSLKVRFNHNGNKFAAIDSTGNLEMWRFDANEDSVDPFLSLPLLKRAADVAFLNAGSVLAVAGEGSGGKNVCIVDTLIPPNRAVVASYNAHDSAGGSASALAYSSRYQMIISGGQKGQVVIADSRQRTVITTIDAHMKSIKDIVLDPSQTFFATASSDGSIKFYSLQTFKEIQSWPAAHVAKGFARSMSSITGVTQIKLSRNSLYSCGADGRVYQRRYSAVELTK